MGARLAFFILVFLLAPAVSAEYYLECNAVVPNITTINCKGHHCKFHTQHTTSYHQDRPGRRNHYIERYCDQDMTTGDDNPCRYPDMQIN